MTMLQLALPVFVMTVSVALIRPRIGPVRLTHAHAAALGALASLLVGAVSLTTVYETAQILIYPVTAIISLMVLTLIAEQAGLFELLAVRLAMLAKGDGRKLFTYIFIAGTITGSIFTNDAAVLIFTPLIFRLVEQVQGPSWGIANKYPYYFAVLYLANLVGAFVTSNPINIIVASFFEIGFIEYARWMMLPALTSILASYIGLRIFFRKALPDHYDLSTLHVPVRDRRFAVVTATVLSLTLIGFFAEHLTGIPTWAVALIAAAALLAMGVGTRRVDAQAVFRGVGWDVIVFVIGIFIVVSGLRNAGLTAYLRHFVLWLGGPEVFGLTLASGFVAGICSALMDNHPTAYAMALAIEDMSFAAGSLGQWAVKRMLVFSALIGGDLGPKMAPIGSLACLMWLRMLRDRGVEVPYSLYLRVGIPLTLSAILLSLLTLYLEYVVAL